MAGVTEIVRAHVVQAVAEAKAAGAPADVIGRSLLDAAVEVMLSAREPADVITELEFVARNVGDDEDYSFMRP